MDFRQIVSVLLLHLLAAVVISATYELGQCDSKAKMDSYLDIAVEMIAKAKHISYKCPKLLPLDCEDVLQNGHNTSGIYTVWPKNRVLNGRSIEVFCDMDTVGGGWTVIQRRGNFSRPNDYFYQDWQSYKNGFGHIEEDFWLGNDNIFALSNQKLYTIRFDLKDVEATKRYALYDTFWIDDEDHKYTLHIRDYSGDAGDSMKAHDNQKFSTRDQDNDSDPKQSCAQVFKGGWWYAGCHSANLNGLYLRGKHDSYADGVNWEAWKGYHESMDTTEIKIRSKDFKKSVLPAEFMTPA